ncbi:MAG: hypothetical protein HYX72_00585 [Acidobacteria bacterium]|nr:hypothetical protein [Acidobacteriota bacterium]
MNRITLKLSRNAVILLAVIAVLAGWVLLSGGEPVRTTAEKTRGLRPTGAPQLLSVAPLPQVESEMCEWQPASATSPITGSLFSAMAAADTPSTDLDRPPVRSIRDPNPSFSAIAVEPNSNMLVVTDENLFQILEYSRLDNTPPNARMTEPKRIIGGHLTKAEMMCGVYIDPVTLDTYIVNNDTQDWLAVFSKDARGNVPPDRWLAVPHGTFGIAVDDARKELFLTIQHNNEVIVYPKFASGHDKPLRELMGDDTRLEDPHGIALDSRNNLIFVTNHGSVSYRGKESTSRRGFVRGSGKLNPPSITVYPRDAQGNTAPVRVISGPKTTLNWPMQIAVDEEREELYVANDMDHSIVVFKTTDNGDVAPTRIIKGSKTKIKNPTGLALDLKNQELWVASMGNHTAALFALNANGNVAPKRVIRGGPANELSLMIGNPGAVGYDTKREQILVPN